MKKRFRFERFSLEVVGTSDSTQSECISLVLLQGSLDLWSDFFTYLFDDSEETSDNAKSDEKYCE